MTKVKGSPVKVEELKNCYWVFCWFACGRCFLTGENFKARGSERVMGAVCFWLFFWLSSELNFLSLLECCAVILFIQTGHEFIFSISTYIDDFTIHTLLFLQPNLTLIYDDFTSSTFNWHFVRNVIVGKRALLKRGLILKMTQSYFILYQLKVKNFV